MQHGENKHLQLSLAALLGMLGASYQEILNVAHQEDQK